MKKYLIDLDGTLYRGSQIIPGAAEWMERLHQRAQDYLLCTNCPLCSPEALVERLARMGIHTAPEHVLTSGMVLKHLYPQGAEITLLGSRSYRAWLKQNGFSFSPDAGIAVIGYDPEMTYQDLQTVCTAILRGARYILTNEDNVIPQGEAYVPHTGAIGAAVHYATGRTPLVLGKPHAPMMEAALALLNVPASDCIVVGDRMDTDMEFAFRNGAESCLLLTGVTSRKDAAQAKEQPTYIFENLGELMKWEDEHQ